MERIPPEKTEERPAAQPGLREPLRLHRGSLYAVFGLLAVVATIAVGWPHLAKAELDAIFGHGHWAANMDWLLAGLGIFFFLCVALSPSRGDLAVASAGLIGGAIIEVWGTRAGLWHYYTFEKPPLWILPAWGISALSNEKLQRVLLAWLPERWKEEIITGETGSKGLRIAYVAVFLPLSCFYLWWSRPALLHPYTLVVTALMFFSLRRIRFPAFALSLFFSGAALGIFLEIWGTTRYCWNYYDHGQPSPFPITGHGMAAVAFWKLKLVLERYVPFFRR